MKHFTVSAFPIIVAVYMLPVFSVCQELIPAYPRGGERLVKEFIDEELNYPAEALKQAIEGAVVLDFIVQEQGLVKDLSIQEPVDPLLKKEALRIFNLLIWHPAEFRGKAVESKTSFTINFNIKKYKKACHQRGYESSPLPAIPIDSSGTVYLYRYIDKQPVPVFTKAGMNLQQFLADNFSYPEEALKRNITGIVKLNFVVEPHGRISNLRVIDHVGAGCTEEAIRLVKMLRWSPGMYYGKAVRVNVSMPISFGLSSEGGYRVAPAAGQTTFQ